MAEQVQQQPCEETSRQHPPPAVVSPAGRDERSGPVTLGIFHHGNGKNNAVMAHVWMSRSWRPPASGAQPDWDELDIHGDQTADSVREILDSGPCAKRALRRA